MRLSDQLLTTSHYIVEASVQQLSSQHEVRLSNKAKKRHSSRNIVAPCFLFSTKIIGFNTKLSFLFRTTLDLLRTIFSEPIKSCFGVRTSHIDFQATEYCT